MMNILLPTDFSENAWNATKYAIDLFENYNCNFYLLHVNRLESIAVGEASYFPTQYEIEKTYSLPSKKKLRQLLKQISEQFSKNKNHKFFSLTDYSFFIESIRKHVDENKIDMIVMGTKGVSGLKEHIIGSNAGDIITKVKCTTLVVPENATYTSLNEIAFPTDLTLTYDVQILEPITTILNDTSATLRMLHIIQKNEQLDKSQKSKKQLLEDYFEGYKVDFHYLTNKKVEDAIQCFVESRDIDMIAMVAKNLNYFQSILFHSKVEKITYHTNVPFLVLHE
ncbi:MAG: universal stress protein [Psychroserpens sp.]|uniref:universal stress protein n=1 Tax=Psychroserpens sp. TaxID=2020870 RepID=UPI00300197FB